MEGIEQFSLSLSFFQKKLPTFGHAPRAFGATLLNLLEHGGTFLLDASLRGAARIAHAGEISAFFRMDAPCPSLREPFLRNPGFAPTERRSDHRLQENLRFAESGTLQLRRQAGRPLWREAIV